MDLYKTIQDLHAEKKTVERAIALIEELQRGGSISPALGVGKRRGRKSMGTEERQEVSERMKKYWARIPWPTTPVGASPALPSPSSSWPPPPDGLAQRGSGATSFSHGESSPHHLPTRRRQEIVLPSPQLNEATFGVV